LWVKTPTPYTGWMLLAISLKETTEIKLAKWSTPNLFLNTSILIAYCIKICMRIVISQSTDMKVIDTTR
jgi:hypothetical protein